MAKQHKNISAGGFLLVASTSFLAAQVITGVEFKGLVHISPQIAQEIIGIEPGMNVDNKEIDQSIKKLYAQKYFDDIWVEENDGVLTYHVKEKPVIAKVKMEGLGEEGNKEVLKSAGLKKGESYDDTRMHKLKKGLEKSLEAQGYYDSVIDIDNKNLNNYALETNIKVRKGENIIIKRVNLIGTKKFGYDDIKEVLVNKEEQSFGWLLGRDDGKLRANQLKTDRERIRKFYLQRGYLDVKVSEPILRANFSDYTATITYKIDEGKQYTVGKVGVYIERGNPEAEKALKNNLKLKTGKIFNVEKLKKDVIYIQDYMSDKGYAFSQVIPDVKQDRQNMIANVTYMVKPNKKIYVRNIVISGNSRTMDRVIRRELYLSEGEPFTKKDMKDSIDALRRTGFFSDVTIVPKQVSSDAMDLVVNVKETSTGSIMGGLSYGSYDGLGVNFGISDKNFLGTGIEVGTNVDYSEKTVSGSLRFYNPRMYDSEYSLGGSIFRRKFDYYDYDEDTLGANLTLGKRIGRNIHVSLGYIYENTELTNVSDSLKNSPYYQEDKQLKSSLVPAISYDDTDDFYLPRRGMHLNFSTEYAGVGGDIKFTRYSFTGKVYKGLEDEIDYDLILRAKVKISKIKDRGNLPLNEKLYLGGYGTVRGFKSGTLSPKDSGNSLIGAKYMAAGTVEASIPLVNSMGLRLKTFYDYGTTGNESFSKIHRSSIGIGLEWPKSPLGVPFEIYYANPLDDKFGDNTTKWEFNLGARF
jgi:outer membrane protein insertion porin family